MNNLIPQFNLKGKLLTFSRPLYLKNALFNGEIKNFLIENPSRINSLEWFVEIDLNQSKFNDDQVLEWQKIKNINPSLTIWILSDDLNLIQPEIFELADFVFSKNPVVDILKMRNIVNRNIPFGISIVLSEVVADTHIIEGEVLISLFDDLLLNIRKWKNLGVKDLFIDIDLDHSLHLINLIPSLKNLSNLKYLEVPITARFSSTSYFNDHVGMEILVETLLELGIVLIRTNECKKLAQMVSLWNNRISLENGN